MSVQGIGQSGSLTEYLRIVATRATASTESVQETGATVESSQMQPPDATIQISKMGEFLSNLETLASEDPEKLKETLAGIAEKLQTAADEAGDTEDGKMLSALAEKFSEAAETGDISGLKPPPPPPQGGAGGPRQAYGSSQQEDEESGIEGVAGRRHAPPALTQETQDLLESLFNEVAAAVEETSAG